MHGDPNLTGVRPTASATRRPETLGEGGTNDAVGTCRDGRFRQYEAGKGESYIFRGRQDQGSKNRPTNFSAERTSKSFHSAQVAAGNVPLPFSYPRWRILFGWAFYVLVCVVTGVTCICHSHFARTAAPAGPPSPCVQMYDSHSRFRTAHCSAGPHASTCMRRAMPSAGATPCITTRNRSVRTGAASLWTRFFMVRPRFSSTTAFHC